MDNTKGLDELKRKLKAVKDYISKDIPVVIGVETVNHFKENFDQEGFVDKSLTKWLPRKDKTNARKLLTFSSELKDSIDYRVEGNTVIITSDKAYAQIHNEGGVIPVSPQMRKFFWAKHYEAKQSGNFEQVDAWKSLALAKQVVITKRPFIGQSEVLNQKIAAKIKRDLTALLK